MSKTNFRRRPGARLLSALSLSALALLLVGPASASAATVNFNGTTLTYTGVPGEQNRAVLYPKPSVPGTINVRDFARDILRREAETVGMPNRQRVLRHPKNPRLHLAVFERRVRFMRRDRAALDENLVGQRDADRFAHIGHAACRRIPSFDGFHGADAPAGGENDAVADVD